MTPPLEPPRHGYRGVPTPPPTARRPRSLTVAVSREAGSRGGTVAAAVGRLLGWPVYTQEMLDFLARDDAARADLLADLPDDTRQWAAAETARLAFDRGLDPASDTVAVAGLVLSVAARGDAVVVGRGAGFLLPPDATLHVRVVAPIEQRVAYLSQWLRMTGPEATAEVRDRDRRRAAFLSAFTAQDVSDPAVYDVVVNSARLGLEGAAEVVAAAVRAKQLAAPSEADEVDPV